MYTLTATAPVAVANNTGNGFTDVPPVPSTDRLADCENDAGSTFFFGTVAWQRGTLAVFNVGTKAASVRVVNLATGLAVPGLDGVNVAPGSQLYFGGLGTGTFRLGATGAQVTVWAGDTQGSNSVDWMGDDLTMNLGVHGRPFTRRSPESGSWILAGQGRRVD